MANTYADFLRERMARERMSPSMPQGGSSDQVYSVPSGGYGSLPIAPPPPEQARVAAAQRLAAALLNEKLNRMRAGEGGATPQSQMTNPQLQAQGPAYGSQAARVAANPSAAPIQQPEIPQGMNIAQLAPVVAQLPAENPVASSYNTYLMGGMTPEQAANRATADNQSNAGLSAITGPVSDAYTAVADSPVGTAVRKTNDVLNWAFEKNYANVAENMYKTAMTGETPNVTNTLNPFDYYFYKTQQVEDWSTDPANKQKIQAAYEVGLDINDDGVVDVKGADAVWMVYNAENRQGFLSTIIDQMGYDPLFAASFVAPVAGGVRKGTAVGMESAMLVDRPVQYQIFKALNKAMTAVETVGEYGNKVADAPFTVPLAAGRKVASAASTLPEWLTRGIRWAGRPSNETETRTIINTAADAADMALTSSAIPNSNVPYGGRGEYSGFGNPQMFPDAPLALPEQSVTNPPNFVSTPYGIAATSPAQSFPNLAMPMLPENSAYPDFRVGPGGQVEPTGPTKTIPPLPEAVVTPDVPKVEPDIPVTGKETSRVRKVGDNGNVQVVRRDPVNGEPVYEVQIKKDPNGKWESKNITSERVTGPDAQATAIEKAKTHVRGGASVTETVTQTPLPKAESVTPTEPARPSVVTWALNEKVDGRLAAAAKQYPTQYAKARRELEPVAAAYEQEVNAIPRTKHGYADRAIRKAEYNADVREALYRNGIPSDQLPNVPRDGYRNPVEQAVGNAIYDNEEIAKKARFALSNEGYAVSKPFREELYNEILEARLQPATVRREGKSVRVPEGSLTVDGVTYSNVGLSAMAPDVRKELADRVRAEQTARYERYQRINLARERLNMKLGDQIQDPAWIAAKQEIVSDQDALIEQGVNTDDVVLSKRFAEQSSSLEDALVKLDNYAAISRTDQRVSLVERIKTYFKDVWAKHQQAHAVNPAFARLLPKMDTVAGGVETVASKELKAEAQRQFTINDEMDIQVARGEIPQETADYLKSPIRNYQIRQKNKWVDVTPQEMAKFAERNKITIPDTGTINDARFRVVEMDRAELLDRTIAKMKDATLLQIEQAYALRVNQLTGTPPPPYHSFAKPIEMIRRPSRHIFRSGRSIALNNPFSIFRGISSDALSDSLRMYWEGHGGAAIQSLTPFGYVEELRHKPREIDRLAQTFGFDIPNEIKVTKGRTELEFDRGSRTATNEAVSALFGAEEGSTRDKVIGAITGAVDNKFGRDTRAGMDDARRQAVFVSEFQKHLPDEQMALYAEARRLGAENGIEPRSVQAYLDDLHEGFTAPQVRDAMTELAKDAELPHDLAVAFGQQIGKDWQTRIAKMRNIANEEQKRVLFSYERRNIDQAIGNVLWYHYWMTRAVPAYARIALRNPEIGAMWLRSWADAKRRAEEMNMPPSFMGYVKVMGSLTGFYHSGNPWNVIMPIVDMKPDAQKEGWYEKLTQFVLLTPAVQIPMSMIGVDSTVVDPLMLYAWRAGAMAVVNEVRAKTGRGPYLDDPYENLLRGGYEMANDLGVKLNIPGVKDVTFQDPKVYTQATIRYVVAGEVEAETGIKMDQWTATEWKMWQDAVFDGEAGIENPIYQAAYEKWADANLKNRSLNSIVPGGMRMRYGPRDEMLYGGELTPDEQQAKTLLDAGSQEDAAITSGMNGLNELGTENGRNSYAAWNAIAFLGQDGSPVDYNSFIQIGTETYYAGDIKDMTDDQRKELADRWVAQYGATDDLASYRTQREAYLAKHPEVGDFKEYQKGVYGMQSEAGGITAWRERVAKQDKGFADAMAETEKRIRDEYPWKTDQVVDIELDRWAASQSAYKVLNGIRDSVYDPPVQPKVPNVGVADYGFTSSASPAASGGSTKSSQTKSPIEKTRTAIENYNTKIEKAVTVMNASGYDVTADDLMFANPYYQKAYAMFDIPSMPYDATLYWSWRLLQPEGTDTSVDAYLSVLEGGRVSA